MMKDDEKNNQFRSREDEIDANITHGKKEYLVDAIKTGANKRKFYHDKPFDEQMYELSEQDMELPKKED